ncbi:MAG TPA: hypothetical protein VIM11_15895 [Tepidisphaeraceae bacterium]|jgi:hypothetical protein
MRKQNKGVLTGESIDGMTNAQREKLVAELEAETPEQRMRRARPLSAQQRATWRRIKKKMGRPRVGEGSKPISHALEKSLLKRADAYAKRHGLKRAELIAQGLRAAMGETRSLARKSA